MKVSISAITRFHIFDLARQMERLGHLERLYTGVPRWMIKEIPLGKVRSMPWLVGPIVLAGRCGMRRIPRILHLPATVVHDRWVARSLTETDVFHCLSSMGTLSLRAAQERFGALAVCDRSSSHILYQLELVRDEYDRLGIPWRGIPSGAIERELADYETADVIVLPSEFAFRSFIDRGFPVQKLRKVPFGVDLSMFRPIEKEDSKFRIIFVGALSVQKGVVYLLEAVESLKDTELWLIGAAQPEMKSILARHQERVRYFGIIPRNELYRYYSQGSVLVMPSLQDGFGLVMSQAMACGLPVIATTNTGAMDLFTDGQEGFIVPIRSSEAIREKILMLKENRALHSAMSRAALERVRSIGGWNAYGERMLEVYREALAMRDRSQH